MLNVVIEVTREIRKEKVATARDLRVPAVNTHGGFGRWAYLEITGPWRAKTALEAALVARAA